MVDLSKPIVNLKKPLREITPVHLLDEIDTMPENIASSACPAVVHGPKPKSREGSKMGILERQQVLADNRKKIVDKIAQSTVFMAKKDLKLEYCSDILEAGHRVVFHAPYYPYYGLDNYNLDIVTVDIGLLIDKSVHSIKFDVARFDDCFEPDFELSRLYSRNIIARLFHRRQIDAYLENVKTEILKNRAGKSLAARGSR